MEYGGAAPRTEYNVQQCKQLHKHFTPLQIKQHLVSLVPWYITLILWITSKFIVFETMVGRLVGWLVWPPVVLLVPSDWPFVTQHQACIPNLISCSPPSPISMAYMALNLSQKAWRDCIPCAGKPHSSCFSLGLFRIVICHNWRLPQPVDTVQTRKSMHNSSAIKENQNIIYILSVLLECNFIWSRSSITETNSIWVPSCKMIPTT